MTTLVEIGQDISATLDLPTVLERIASRAKELVRANTIAIYLQQECKIATQYRHAAVEDITATFQYGTRQLVDDAGSVGAQGRQHQLVIRFYGCVVHACSGPGSS